MAGSAEITGVQHYTLGIGHPKAAPDSESFPITANSGTGLITDPAARSAVAEAARLAVPLEIVPRLTDVMSSPPTITYSATAPSSGHRYAPNDVTPIGCALSWNSSLSIFDAVVAGGFAGTDQFVTADSVTLGWRCQTSGAERVMIYVDGKPAMSSPATPSVSTTAGQYYWVTVAFGSVARRRVTVLVTSINGLVGIVVPTTGVVQPGPRTRRVLIVGDSFNAGSAAISNNTYLPASRMALSYDMNVANGALGGTGYVKTNGSFKQFGDPGRVANAVLFDPDDIIFMGSVNDDGQGTIAEIQAAAGACYDAYMGACPRARITVFGPQPSNATDTVSANRRDNHLAVQAACASRNIQYYDMIGFGDGSTRRAYANFTLFNPGEIVSHLGAYWQLTYTVAAQFPGSGAPGSYGYTGWRALTYELFGTGKVGSTASDGTRDVLLYSDGIHPTELACDPLMTRMYASIVR